MCIGLLRGKVGEGVTVFSPAAPLVQLKLKRVNPILEVAEQITKIGVIHGFARLIQHKILFRNISHVIAFFVFGEQMVKRLIPTGPSIFGDGAVPFFAIGKHRINVEDNTAKRMFPVPQDLSQMVFRLRLQHRIAPLIPNQ